MHTDIVLYLHQRLMYLHQQLCGKKAKTRRIISTNSAPTFRFVHSYSLLLRMCSASDDRRDVCRSVVIKPTRNFVGSFCVLFRFIYVFMHLTK